MNLRQMLERRARLVAQARGLLDGAAGEDRDLTAEEQGQYDSLMDEIGQLTERIQREERLMTVERNLQATMGAATRPDPDGEPGDERNDTPPAIEFRSRGMQQINEQDPAWLENREWARAMRTAAPEYVRAWRQWARTGEEGELRALQADLDASGGYLRPPMQFVDRLIQAVDNAVYLRQWATIYAVANAESLGAPSLDNDPADPTWTSELAIGTEDSTMSFGRRELHPHPLAKYIKVSRKLLRAVPSVEDLVIGRLGYKFAVTSENAYLNGDGAGEPLGVFTASDDGISTGRDVSTGNTDTEIRFDGLIEAKYTLKQQYWPRARWLFHRDGVKMIAKLKDGEGQYLWRESVRVGEPDRILNIPVFMSEYAPNTFTTGLYVGILGDFSWYWIADALMMEMQRLNELYAATNQVGFIGRLESDGMPVLEEAFVRVTLT